MTAMNIVHMRVKPGGEAAFLDIHRQFSLDGLAGVRSFQVIKTGERSFCVVGEWESMASMAAARPAMIANLDRLRSVLEDLGGGRGVTEPWSGDVVVESRPDISGAAL